MRRSRPTDEAETAKSIRPPRQRPAKSVVVALLILTIAASCQRVTIEEYEPECRSWGHGDVFPTKDNPQPTPIYFCNDP
jgi:hypothetical protein